MTNDEPRWHACDYKHSDGRDRPADWVHIGEAGDYYVCDDHFQMRTEESRRNWHRVDKAPR